MRTLAQMFDKVEAAQKDATAANRFGSWDQFGAAVERVDTMRDLMGLSKWDRKSLTVTERDLPR